MPVLVAVLALLLVPAAARAQSWNTDEVRSLVDRGIARHGYDVYVGDAKAGVVTSGTQTPFLKKAIGMAYLPVGQTAPGTEFDVDIRGRRTRARVVPMPFYKRAK